MGRTESGRASRRVLVVSGLVIVGVLVLAVVLGAVRDPAQFDAGTPEATVQAFLRALQDDDAEAIRATFTAELAASCPLQGIDWSFERIARAVLFGTRIDGDRAVVQLDVTERYDSGPFGASDSTRRQRFVLGEVADEWRIAEAPWPLYQCQRPS